MADSDRYFRMCRLSVRPSVPTFQNFAKQNKVSAGIVIATGGTVGLAEWIIDSAIKWRNKCAVISTGKLVHFPSQLFPFKVEKEA